MISVWSVTPAPYGMPWNKDALEGPFLFDYLWYILEMVSSIQVDIDRMLQVAREEDADSDIIVEIDNLSTSGPIDFTRDFCRLLKKATDNPRMSSWTRLYSLFQEIRNHYFTTYTSELMKAGVIVRKVMGDKAVIAEPDIADGINRDTDLPASQMMQSTSSVHIRLQRKLALREAERRRQTQKEASKAAETVVRDDCLGTPAQQAEQAEKKASKKKKGSRKPKRRTPGF